MSITSKSGDLTRKNMGKIMVAWHGYRELTLRGFSCFNICWWSVD